MKKAFIIFLAITLVLAVGVNVAFAIPTGATGINETKLAAEAGNSPAASPSQNADPTLTPTPPVPLSGDIAIDNYSKYQGMAMSYGAGYVPTISGNTVLLRLPIVPVDWVPGEGEANKNITMNVSLSLGGESSPFVIKTYDTPFNYGNQATTNFEGKPSQMAAWLVAFDLELKPNRYMGTYPVTANVSYTRDGAVFTEAYTINVTVDGIDPKATSTPTPEPSVGPHSAPKVIISNYTISPEIVYAGEAFDVNITLRNTSAKEAIKNIVVTYKSQTTDLLPDSNTNSFYIDNIGKESTESFGFKIKARADAKPGPQKIDIAIAYEDAKAAALTAADEITVQVRQKIRLEHDEPKFPTDIPVGSSVPATLKLYNKGKNVLYNVTANLDVPGITPDASAFLGNMNPGDSKTADIYAIVSGEVIGETSGNYTVTYEDEYGDSYTLEIPVNTILSEMTQPDMPMEDMPTEPEQTGLPWWVYVIIAGGAAAVIIIVVVAVKKKKRHKELEQEIEDDELF